MARVTIALCPKEVPPPPTLPPPAPSPLGHLIAHTVDNTDYDLLCVPLTNGRWMDRWERLCLRSMDDEEHMYSASAGGSVSAASADGLAPRPSDTDREADVWRKDPMLNRDECNITRFEDAAEVVALASPWLEPDSVDEGIRFDSELVSRVIARKCRGRPLRSLFHGFPHFILTGRDSAPRCNTHCT